MPVLKGSGIDGSARWVFPLQPSLHFGGNLVRLNGLQILSKELFYLVCATPFQ